MNKIDFKIKLAQEQAKHQMKMMKMYAATQAQILQMKYGINNQHHQNIERIEKYIS